MKSLIVTIVTFFIAQSAIFAQCSVSFTASVSGATATFTVTSTPPTYSGLLNADNFWYYGDGNSNSVNYHTYAVAGTYYPQLVRTWRDSMTNAVICVDSVSGPAVVTTTTAPKQITGFISVDTTTGTGNPTSPAYKVWLIQYDASTQDLSAVDSVSVTGSRSYTAYTFNNPAAGSYRVKAALTNGPTSGTAAVPTYDNDSLYWYNAVIITYSGTGVSTGNNIIMQQGTVTSGPGFVAGNVTSGANKSTQTTGNGAGVGNIVIFLETTSGKVLAYQTTDGNGHYSFSNIPAGTYHIYPEILNCRTAPATVVVGATQITDIDFIQHTISKTVTPVNVGVANVAAAKSNFNVFPNPGTGVFNISWSSTNPLQAANATVSDVTGRKVYETPLNMNAQSGKTQLNLSNLQSGMYFININAGNVNYTNKIVLQH
ncbi:MAG: T9SS type A sorting domain-containing protein [Flavipsychrobacter sp.]|nr:T9SS type A sorting domain-containing protein [Flavipsychrobacter sp.]